MYFRVPCKLAQVTRWQVPEIPMWGDERWCRFRLGLTSKYMLFYDLLRSLWRFFQPGPYFTMSAPELFISILTIVHISQFNLWSANIREMWFFSSTMYPHHTISLQGSAAVGLGIIWVYFKRFHSIRPTSYIAIITSFGYSRKRIYIIVPIPTKKRNKGVKYFSPILQIPKKIFHNEVIIMKKGDERR